MLCLAFIHNILRRHRACNILLNRDSKESEAGTALGSDPYLDNEADPANSRAIESSLWEVKSLCNHYYVQARLLPRLTISSKVFKQLPAFPCEGLTACITALISLISLMTAAGPGKLDTRSA